VNREFLPLAIIALIFIIAFYAEPLVKTNEKGQIITHWNFKGEADGWMDKQVGIYLIPVLTLVLYAGLLLIPKIAVYKKNIGLFSQQFWGFKVIVVFMMGVIYVGALIPNLGYWKSFDPVTIIVPAVALLFFYVGYMLNFTKRNFFIGIRTPWTLANEKVWDKTNKLAGKLFWICGALTLLALVSPSDFKLWIVLLPITIVVIGLVIYSLFEYRKTKRLQKKKRKRKKQRK